MEYNRNRKQILTQQFIKCILLWLVLAFIAAEPAQALLSQNHAGDEWRSAPKYRVMGYAQNAPGRFVFCPQLRLQLAMGCEASADETASGQGNYCNGDPVNGLDPDGRFGKSVVNNIENSSSLSYEGGYVLFSSQATWSERGEGALVMVAGAVDVGINFTGVEGIGDALFKNVGEDVLRGGLEDVVQTGGQDLLQSGGQDLLQSAPSDVMGVTPAAEGGGGITTLFHGTDLESAQNIVTNGIDQQAAREMGGGDVFWTTHEQDLADLFAQANPKGGAPATVQFDLSSSSLNSLLQSGAAKFDPVVNGYQINDWDAFNAAVLRSSIK